MNRHHWLRWLLGGFLLCHLLPGCQAAGPIKIGYAGDLTGKNAGIGVQGRNGAEIAVQEINAAGGIGGRTIELLIQDNGGTPEGLLAVDEMLISQNVVALLGHMASWESVSAYPIIQEKKIVLFSATTSTPELSGKDDYFFRLMPGNPHHSQPLVDYAIENQWLRAALVYDLSNKAYTQTYADNCAAQFEQKGGHVVGQITFDQTTSPDLQPLVAQIRAMQPDVILVVASGLNTALLTQYIRLDKWDVPVITSNWAYTDELLQNGGRAIEGVVLTSHFFNDCNTPEYLAFKQKYQATYGQFPTFAAAMSYETTYFLTQALRQTKGQTQGLKEALEQVGTMRGLCEDIVMDEYGDVLRTLYLIRVQGGTFTLLDEISPRR
jgi:branched-chain amino acid transport system substrate-binding protein